MTLVLISLALLLALPARASDVTNELGVNTTQATESNPRAGNVSDSLQASFDLGDQWSIEGGAVLTREGQTGASEAGGFGTSGNLVTMFSLGTEFEPNDRWTLALHGDFSPQSTQQVGTSLTLATGPAFLLLRAQSAQVEGGLDVSFDTSGDSDLEWSLSAGLTGSHLSMDQAIDSVRFHRTLSGPLVGGTADDIRASCATKRCPPRLVQALQPAGQNGSTLDWEKFTFSATATVLRDTDLGLTADAFHYEDDPSKVGYLSVALAHLGTGIPIAPVQYLIRPEVVQRIGGFSARLWVQTGRYVSGLGDSTAELGIKLQYKFSKAYRMWVMASGQRDTDEFGGATKSGSLALGAGYRF